MMRTMMKECYDEKKNRADGNCIPVDKIVCIYSREAARIYGDKLKAVILYGSYARGDYDKESDIDLMILLDMPREKIPEARKLMRRTADDLDMQYDCVISTTFQSYDFYEDYKTVSRFYQNVEKDGVLVGQGV